MGATKKHLRDGGALCYSLLKVKHRLLISLSLLVLVFSFAITALPQKAYADKKSGDAIPGVTEDAIRNAKPAWVNAAVLNIKIGPITLQFYDKDLGDPNHTYALKGYYTTDPTNLQAYSCDAV